MSTWPPERCATNGCSGCLGIALSCGHSFPCVMDPEFGSHRCAASWNNALFALLMGAVAFALAAWLVSA